MNLEILLPLLPYVCLIGGICLLVLGIVIRNKLVDSESWPKTTGLIVKSSVEPGFSRVGAKNNYMYVVRPKVTYEYEVHGKNYSSSQLALVEHDSANEKLARGKAEKYPLGQHVEVYYNPRKPEFAVLEVGDPTGGKLPYGITIFGILLAISAVVWICARQH